MTDFIYINSDMIATLKGLKDESGTAVTGAVVELTLLSGGTEVSGATWPVAMSHTSGGDYTAALSKDLTLTGGERVTAKIVATAGGKQLEVYYNTKAVQRRLN